MKTASFFSYPGPGKISIARRSPRGFADFKVCHQLAPNFANWNTVSHDRYLVLFERQLAQLDPQKMYDELYKMVATERCPVEPVLLCWEKPPLSPANWCHRRMVAEWFERTLKIQVPECDALRGTSSGLFF